MEFQATVFFDLVARDVWRLYRILAGAAQAGAELSMHWRPFAAPEAPDRDVLAAFAHVQADDPARHGIFLQALLTLHHTQGHAPGWELVSAAAELAGIEADPLVRTVRDAGGGYDRVDEGYVEGTAMGVTRTPTLYHYGPLLYVKTTPAIAEGDPIARLGIIDAMMRDDGLWELSKP